MSQLTSQSTSRDNRIGCIVNLIALWVAIAALAWQIMSSRSDLAAIETHLNNQAIQIALIDEGIDVGREQLAVAIEQLTVMAALSDTQEQQVGTPSLADSELIPTATVLAEEAGRLEATRQAIETRQRELQATQTAVAGQAILPEPPHPAPTATTTTISRRVCGDEGAFEARNTPNPTFLRPTGFVSGWLSSDPAKITLPDGTSRTFETQFVLIVQDSEWVRIDGVGMANGNAQAWGCWYTTNEFVEQDAMQDMCIKQKAGSFGRLYRVDYNGLTELGTTQTIECP